MCTKEELIIEASERIANLDDCAIEVAEELGQDINDVMNQKWFTEAVAKHIANEDEKWNHLKDSF